MSATIIPNSGPFNDPGLDDLRQSALYAVDRIGATVVPELVDYLQALERRHLELGHSVNKEFLHASWECRRGKPLA